MKKVMLFVLAILLANVVYAQCSSEDTACRLQELEDRVAQLEQETAALDTLLQSITSWLFFSENQHVCAAVAEGCIVEEEPIVCSDNSDCVVTQEVTVSCQGNTVVESSQVPACNFAGTPESFCSTQQVNVVLEQCEHGCQDAACLPAPTVENESVVFRTNVNALHFYPSWNNSWIAVDKDRDGSLEGYGYRARGSWNFARCNAVTLCTENADTPCIIAYAPNNDKVIDYGSSTQVQICDQSVHRTVLYRINDPDAASAELSSSPTEPYSSNGQETLV